MILNHLSGDGKTYSGCFEVGGIVQPSEDTKNMLGIFLVKTDPVVANRNLMKSATWGSLLGASYTSHTVVCISVFKSAYHFK